MTMGLSTLQPLRPNSQGIVSGISGISHSAGLPKHVAERQAAGATRTIQDGNLPFPSIGVDADEHRFSSVGSGIVLAATTSTAQVLGSDSLGEKGRPAENVGSSAGMTLLEEISSRAELDRHMGDMIVPYLALANGHSEISISRLTQHTLTNVKVAEWLTGAKLDLEGEVDHFGKLRVDGIGSTQ